VERQADVVFPVKAPGFPRSLATLKARMECPEAIRQSHRKTWPASNQSKLREPKPEKGMRARALLGAYASRRPKERMHARACHKDYASPTPEAGMALCRRCRALSPDAQAVTLAAVELTLDLNPRTATKNAAAWHLLLQTSSHLRESKHEKKLKSTARNTQ